MSVTTRPDALLRRVLLLDALSCAGMGAVLLAAPGLLTRVLGLPEPLTRGAGLALLPFAALLVWTARRPEVPRGVAWALVAGNALWALDSFALPATAWLGEATALGVAFVVAQGAVVAAFAALEAVGLRRAAA